MARRREIDPFLALHHSRKRKRLKRKQHRGHAGAILAAVAGGPVILLLLAGFGAGAALSDSCSLSSLKPVDIGANTFIYAADGSLLGSIPADRNRDPVPMSRISTWLPKATVAVEDRRFYQHGG